MSRKPSWLYRQSAAIPFISKKDRYEIVLVSSNAKSSWIFPKGIIERFFSPEDAAAKEALEEAGVIGEIYSTQLTEYQYEKWGGNCTVKVFPLKVQKLLPEWEEMDMRERIVVRIEEAVELVKQEQKISLKRLKEFIEDKKV